VAGASRDPLTVEFGSKVASAARVGRLVRPMGRGGPGATSLLVDFEADPSRIALASQPPDS